MQPGFARKARRYWRWFRLTPALLVVGCGEPTLPDELFVGSWDLVQLNGGPLPGTFQGWTATDGRLHLGADRAMYYGVGGVTCCGIGGGPIHLQVSAEGTWEPSHRGVRLATSEPMKEVTFENGLLVGTYLGNRLGFRRDSTS